MGPKPITSSWTIWFNVLIMVLPAVFPWAASHHWITLTAEDQTFLTVFMEALGGGNVALRFKTKQAVAWNPDSAQ